MPTSDSRSGSDHPRPRSDPRSRSDSRPGSDGATSEEDDPGRLVRSLQRQLPEFGPAYLTLADACGDDPGEPLVLMELADFVAHRMVAVEADRSVVERALAAVEAHLESISDDEIGCELIAFAFFDSFSPDQRELLSPRLGPGSRMLIDGLDLPDTGWQEQR